MSLDTGGLSSAQIPVGPLRFIPVPPCRVVDTRDPNGPLGGPLLSGGVSRDFAVPNGLCSIPSSAQAYSINVTVIPSGPLGLFGCGRRGNWSLVRLSLNSYDGRVKAVAAIVGAGAAGAISVLATSDTHLVIDINGYFVPASNSAGLAYYRLTPCRIADTRVSGPLPPGLLEPLPSSLVLVAFLQPRRRMH